MDPYEDISIEDSNLGSRPFPGLEEPSQASTTVGVKIKNDRLYTYQCARPVEVGDRVNIKLPSGLIMTTAVEVVHDTPQLSDKWETKWCVVVQTRAEYEASAAQGSELGQMLGL